jgi:arylsulfatase A-like enzyme
VLARSLAVVQLVDRLESRLRPGYDPSFETMLRFLDEGAAPLFLFVHIMDVHSPYVPPHPWGPRFDARPEGAPEVARDGGAPRKRNRFGWRPSEEAYSAEIRFADEKIGRLRRALDERGLLDSAIFVLSSDHGENLLDHEPHFSHGRTLYDATLRILLAIRGGGAERGRLVARPVENVDVLPEIARLMHEAPLDFWEGRAPGADSTDAADAAHRAAFAQLQRDFAIRTPVEKVVLPENDAASRFDLVADPGERTPLPLSAEETKSAAARLQDWLARTSTPLYTNAARAVRPEELSEETVEKLRALGYVD